MSTPGTSAEDKAYTIYSIYGGSILAGLESWGFCDVSAPVWKKLIWVVPKLSKENTIVLARQQPCA
jgi:hypothetical protein